jgi:prolyl oligopeptidase
MHSQCGKRIRENPAILQFMKRFFFFVLPILAAMPGQAQLNYPPTKIVDASDTYFGKKYNDPYRWLENLKDKEVAAWFKAQAELTDGLLAKIPGRDALAGLYKLVQAKRNKSPVRIG